jgi:hypothetical protein
MTGVTAIAYVLNAGDVRDLVLHNRQPMDVKIGGRASAGICQYTLQSNDEALLRRCRSMCSSARPNSRVWWCGALDLIAQGRLSLALYPQGNLISTLKLLNRVSITQRLALDYTVCDRLATAMTSRKSWEPMGAVGNSRQISKVSLGTLI